MSSDSDYVIRPAIVTDLKDVGELLTTSQLPASDVASHISHFFVACTKNQIIGVGGLEIIGTRRGLIRSFAVRENYRGRGIAEQLHRNVLQHAERLEIHELYLLTTTAQNYFTKLGYEVLDRKDAPPSVMQTEQFRELCPQSAALMRYCL